MTDTKALDALIEAVEAGQEYLEREVQNAFGGYRRSTVSQEAIKAYHGSLDAAKALHEALLPGWALQGMSMFPSGIWIASVYEPKGDEWPKWTPYPSKDATANDPARAWLLAVLKAYRASL